MLYAIVALLLLLADQGMKYWTTTHVVLDTGKHMVLPGLVDLRNIHNTGSAFSFLGDWAGARWLFLAVTVVFAVLVVLVLRKKIIRGSFGRWMALCVLAGALGNAIDRGLYGYVIDMFEFAFFPSFPVFNTADIYITVCGVLFCLYVLLNKEPFGAPAEELRAGPGGSVTRPAPKKAEEKKPKEPKLPKERKPLFAAKAESAAARPEKAAVKAEKRTAEPVADGKENSRVRLRGSRTPEKSERDLKFEALKRPVVTHESFLEGTRRKPGNDPFTEWSSPSTPVRTVEPEEPTRVLANPKPAAPVMPEPEEPTRVMPRVEAPEASNEAMPVAEAYDLHDFFANSPSASEGMNAPTRVARDTAREQNTAPAKEAQETPETDARKPAADVDEDPMYSLEDILNEFRDL